MAGNSEKPGAADRRQVSGQDHEREYLMKNFKISRQQLDGVRRAVGNVSRRKIEAHLKERI